MSETDEDDDERISYSIDLKRNNVDGSVSMITISDYGLLHEALEHIIDQADGKGWLRMWPT